ncbi:MAG: protein-L-isoaspartate(D-aspartate) O-methyltransferase [Anaerolineales bacterium]
MLYSLTMGLNDISPAFQRDVLRAMRAVPRERFVLPEDVALAYEDRPLSIGEGQTISQPSLVRRMTEWLDLRAGERVLEVGAGSGYQTAILAELGYVEVYSVELMPGLCAAAAERLRALGYSHVQLRQGDGYLGWPEAAPFNAMIVTAAAPHLPPPLVAQLAEGGRLVIPIGPAGTEQTLYRLLKRAGRLQVLQRINVAFVPLRRPHDMI